MANFKLGPTLVALGSAMASNNFSNVGSDILAHSENAKRRKQQENYTNHTVNLLEAEGADPRFIDMARNGFGKDALHYHLQLKKAQKPANPFTDFGRAKRDLDAGDITQDQYNTLTTPNAPQRRIINDSAGFPRFVDTGKRVFPEEEAQPSHNLTTKQQNELSTAQSAITSLESELDGYQQLVGKHGYEVAPTEAKDAILTKRRNIQMQMKELYNLGVLNGPDLELMDQMVFDAAPGVLRAAGGNIVDFFGGPSAAERTNANAEQLKQQIRDLLNAKRKSLGLTPKTHSEFGTKEKFGATPDLSDVPTDTLRKIAGQ